MPDKSTITEVIENAMSIQLLAIAMLNGGGQTSAPINNAFDSEYEPAVYGGNDTIAVNKNDLQELVNQFRKAIKLVKSGEPSKARERNVMRRTIKKLKNALPEGTLPEAA